MTKKETKKIETIAKVMAAKETLQAFGEPAIGQVSKMLQEVIDLLTK